MVIGVYLKTSTFVTAKAFIPQWLCLKPKYHNIIQSLSSKLIGTASWLAIGKIESKAKLPNLNVTQR